VLAAAALVRAPTQTLLGAMLEGDAKAHYATLVGHVPLAKVGTRLALPDTLREAALDDLASRAPELRVTWSRRAQDALLASLDAAPQRASTAGRGAAARVRRRALRGRVVGHAGRPSLREGRRGPRAARGAALPG
jgi:hypothetical protein